jgi:DNA-binding transcriptional MerR regulator
MGGYKKMRKLLTIGELADILSINVSTIRHYEREGLITPSKIDDNNYRLYDYDRLDRMQNLILLRSLDIPIKDLKNLIDNYTVEKYNKLLNDSLNNINNKIDDLNEKKKAVNEKLLYVKNITKDEPTFRILNQDKRTLLKLHSDNLLTISLKEFYEFMNQYSWFKYSQIDCSYIQPLSDNLFSSYIDYDLFEEAKKECELFTLESGNYVTYGFFIKIDPKISDKIEIVEAEDQIVDEAIIKFNNYIKENNLNIVGPTMIKQMIKSSHFALYSFYMTIEALIK